MCLFSQMCNFPISWIKQQLQCQKFQGLRINIIKQLLPYAKIMVNSVLIHIIIRILSKLASAFDRTNCCMYFDKLIIYSPPNETDSTSVYRRWNYQKPKFAPIGVSSKTPMVSKGAVITPTVSTTASRDDWKVGIFLLENCLSRFAYQDILFSHRTLSKFLSWQVLENKM